MNQSNYKSYNINEKILKLKLHFQVLRTLIVMQEP